MKRILFIGILVFLLSGCFTVSSKKVVLLPEDRIFTLPAGQPVKLKLDGKPINMTFPQDMKVVSSTFLVRQEVKQNKKLFKSVKEEKNKAKIYSIISGLVGISLGLLKNLKKKKK